MGVLEKVDVQNRLSVLKQALEIAQSTEHFTEGFANTKLRGVISRRTLFRRRLQPDSFTLKELIRIHDRLLQNIG